MTRSVSIFVESVSCLPAGLGNGLIHTKALCLVLFKILAKVRELLSKKLKPRNFELTEYSLSTIAVSKEDVAYVWTCEIKQYKSIWLWLISAIYSLSLIKSYVDTIRAVHSIYH